MENFGECIFVDIEKCFLTVFIFTEMGKWLPYGIRDVFPRKLSSLSWIFDLMILNLA